MLDYVHWLEVSDALDKAVNSRPRHLQVRSRLQAVFLINRQVRRIISRSDRRQHELLLALRLLDLPAELVMAQLVLLMLLLEQDALPGVCRLLAQIAIDRIVLVDVLGHLNHALAELVVVDNDWLLLLETVVTSLRHGHLNEHQVSLGQQFAVNVAMVAVVLARDFEIREIQENLRHRSQVALVNQSLELVLQHCV